MDNLSSPVVARLKMLGISCEDVPLDRWSSPIAALACFPMYMVANHHAWSGARQFKVPIVDIPGSEAIREAAAIGGQEARLVVDKEHLKVVDSMLSSARPPDRVIYEYALETLRDFLTIASPTFAEEMRTAVARMIVAVSKASGEGIFGTGEKVSPEERLCIARIDADLHLAESPEASKILYGLDSV
jgi:hypothetical protein